MRQFSTLVLWLSFFLYGVSAVPPNGATDFWQYPTVPTGRGQHAAIWTGEEMIVWGGVNAGAANIPPTQLNDGARYNPITKKWALLSRQNVPEAPGAPAFWTGKEMIVWSGNGNGGRYNPRTDSWTSINQQGAPSHRYWNSVSWTGTELIVWGGHASYYLEVGDYLQDGAAYNPATDTWRSISLNGAPSPRGNHVALWTGSEMLVWSGSDNHGNLADGARYDPTSDTWKPITAAGMTAGSSAAAVWTGREMLVLGATGEFNAPPGVRYDPKTDQWRPISAKGAVLGGSPVWTGSEVIIWGRTVLSTGVPINSMARYDPASDSWASLPEVNPPSSRYEYSAVWTGSRMLIWGGNYSETIDDYSRHYTRSYANGGEFDPVTHVWTAIGQSDPPSGRTFHSAVWTGSEMIVWGGDSNAKDGGRYDPAVGEFKRMAPAPVLGRALHSAVWTGREMIVWGGLYSPSFLSGSPKVLNTGARYDPRLDQWAVMSTNNAPDPRYAHTAVWTGKEMLVWGGAGFSAPFFDTGSRYDPETDSWKPLNTNGAPSARTGHVALWTGREMIVWGGWSGSYNTGYQYFQDGARYDPERDSWRPMNTNGAPITGGSGTAVWTGTEMLVWGGSKPSNDVGTAPAGLNAGARYDPAEDSWKPIGLSGNPRPRFAHTAVWTGSDMIVWCGGPDSGGVATGDRYNPQTDSWQHMSVIGAPAPRFEQTAVWTGTEMVIWGGQTLDGVPRDDVAIYTPRPPSLEVSKAAGETALIQWDFPSAGFRLQEAAGLLGAGEWKEVNGVPERGDSGWRLKAGSSSWGFYRLIAE
jgi:N-acetylneuraminic acid mutarotase